MQSQAEGKRTAEPAWTGNEPAQTPSANDLSHSRGGCHHADARHGHDLPCAIETAASADAAASDPAFSMMLRDPHERAADAPAVSGGEVGGHGRVRVWVCAHVDFCKLEQDTMLPPPCGLRWARAGWPTAL
jgi:hypothetical protein